MNLMMRWRALSNGLRILAGNIKYLGLLPFLKYYLFAQGVQVPGDQRSPDGVQILKQRQQRFKSNHQQYL